MPIVIQCRSCGSQLQFADEDSGRTAICLDCHAAVSVVRATSRADEIPIAPVLPADWEGDSAAPPVSQPEPELSFGSSGRGTGGRYRPHSTWTLFCCGCQWLARSLWVEWGGLLYLHVVVVYVIYCAYIDPRVPPKLIKSAGPFLFLGFFAPMAIGGTVIAFCRVMMVRIPRGSGAGLVFYGGAALSILRMLALQSALVLVVLAGVDWQAAGGRVLQYMDQALLGYWIAVCAGLVVDLTVVTGLAIIGGATRSARLMQKSSKFSFWIQLLAIAWLGTISAIYALGLASDIFGAVLPRAGNPKRGQDKPDATLAMVVGCLVIICIFAFQTVYTYLSFQLYAAGRNAVTSSEPTLG